MSEVNTENRLLNFEELWNEAKEDLSSLELAIKVGVPQELVSKWIYGFEDAPPKAVRILREYLAQRDREDDADTEDSKPLAVHAGEVARVYPIRPSQFTKPAKEPKKSNGKVRSHDPIEVRQARRTEFLSLVDGIKSRGVTVRTLSEKIGFNQTYLSHLKGKETIYPSAHLVEQLRVFLAELNAAAPVIAPEEPAPAVAEQAQADEASTEVFTYLRPKVDKQALKDEAIALIAGSGLKKAAIARLTGYSQGAISSVSKQGNGHYPSKDMLSRLKQVVAEHGKKVGEKKETPMQKIAVTHTQRVEVRKAEPANDRAAAIDATLASLDFGAAGNDDVDPVEALVKAAAYLKRLKADKAEIEAKIAAAQKAVADYAARVAA